MYLTARPLLALGTLHVLIPFFFCPTHQPTFTRGGAIGNETFYWDGLTRNHVVNVENLVENQFICYVGLVLFTFLHRRNAYGNSFPFKIKRWKLIFVACVKLQLQLHFSEHARTQRNFWSSPQHMFVSVNAIPAWSQVLTLG